MPLAVPLPDDDASNTKHSRDSPGATDELPTQDESGQSHGSSPSGSPPALARVRVRANSKKESPTLLTDFLRGKQSPARLAAERKRRESVEMVRAELRREMRQSAVRKIQQPGGVRDRVNKWQKAHASAMVEGDPDDAATEPTDVAFKEDDEESVTEEDRIRIKLRQQRRRATPKPKPSPEGGHSEKENEDTHARPSPSPPKKKVVNDDYWKKPKSGRRSPPRKVSPLLRKHATFPRGLPGDFVQQAGTTSPLVSTKVKEWAAKMEVHDTTPLRRAQSPRTRNMRARSHGSRSGADDSASNVTARQASGPRSWQADGIRVTALPIERPDDDGIRVHALPPQKQDHDGIRIVPTKPAASPRDDGIRIRPTREESPADTHTDEIRQVSRSRSRTASLSARRSSPTTRRHNTKDHAEQQRSHSEAKKQSDELATPTRAKGSRRLPSRVLQTESSRARDDCSSLSEEHSNLSSARNAASDIASSLANKSIADIPGEIHFGHSAFSELDLTVEGQPRSRPRREKVDRTTSLKTMPNVFKKVVEEGKKIIHEMNESSRPVVANNPPSIEKWLNNTVDPFVDSRPTAATAAATAAAAADEGSKLDAEEDIDRVGKDAREGKTPRRRDSLGAKSSEPSTAGSRGKEQRRAHNCESTQARDSPATSEASEEPASTTPTGLKRSGATRSSTSPVKTGRGKRPLFGAIKDAFHGESSTLPTRSRPGQSHESRKVSYADDAPRSRSLSASGSSGEPSARVEASRVLPPPRPPPPTRGDHELSTILSEESSSAVESDMTSDVSNSTLTQLTSLTADCDVPSTHTNHAPGLKRRLTKHSDLVSVLSLPDDSTVPNAIRSRRSRPSLRRDRSLSGHVTAQELLREFADDESLYLRELKTLVDGVVPVLLSHVVNGTNASEIFGPSASGSIPDSVSKSVVNMGVALEKLKSAHRKASTSDIRKLANWAHGVVPIYKNYLSAWRLGFDDIVVNLAPAANALDEDDSLLAALPRNDDGDVIHANGERVAVAHLLKRPLIRVKQLAKLMRCIDSILASTDTHELARDFDDLQCLARRRFKEENARIIDEEAINTDTSRCRDLSSLAAAPAVSIDPNRQVSAKDLFSLSLVHSNQQKLDCQVELVYRDSPKDVNDKGDVLIRDTGEGRHSYLLFPPIDVSCLSARTGDSDFEMTVMVRETSHGHGWREFFTLRADHEDQILDWLDILPLQPVPPLDFQNLHSKQPTTPTRPREPVLGSHLDGSAEKSPRSPIAKDVCAPSPSTAPKKTSPARYHQRGLPTEDVGATFAAPSQPKSRDPDKTPTKEDARTVLDCEGRGRPLREDMRPDPSHFQIRKQSQPPSTTAYREDGAPPPPAHRTLSSGSPQAAGGIKGAGPSLQPATDSHVSDRLKRRGSSPLKHEYLPSDQSSTSDAPSTEESDPESSDDEIESIDIPETELGVSLKSDTGPRSMPGSEASLTPSASASQADLHGSKASHGDQASRFVARISRWSDKGLWKDVTADACSVVVTDGLIEAYALRTAADTGNLDPPLLALDLTPLVLIRQSTAVDLEIRSSVQSHSKLYQSRSGGNFRFRCSAAPDCYNLYMAVHQARLHNQKFIQLENEARFKSFGERPGPGEADGEAGTKRRSWFGRKNSYRSSVRAPSQSHDGASTTPSSTPSASSFLKRLTINGNLSFNIARSSVDRQSRAGRSLYTSGSSSSADGTPPRSPSVSVENSGQRPTTSFGGGESGSSGVRVRLHLLVTPAKWEDHGNCTLQVRQPPRGWRQALRANHGLEKRITVTTVPKKDADEPRVALDAVLGSGCFSPMGSRGIVCGVWEEVKNGAGVVGMVPETGATGGNIKKWCFQFANVAEAHGVLRLVHQEVMRA